MSDDRAKRLVEAREALNLTQEGFSTQSGIPLSTLKKYEGNHRAPGADALEAYAKAGIDVVWVLTGIGGPLLAARKPDASAVQAVDLAILQGVVDFFHSWLYERRDQVRIDRNRHGLIISILYKAAVQSGGVEKRDLDHIMKLAA